MADVAPPSQDILVATGVAAGYGGRPVVSGIDLTVRSGEIVGLLGANGSGKSTLLKALTGQIRLQAGTVSLAGIDVGRDPVRAKENLGLAIEAAEVPTALTGRQYLELVASIRRCAADDWPDGDLVALFGLTPWIAHPIATYSLGTRMKLSIAAALLGAPPLLVFDESLNGLDPVAAFTLKRLIGRLAARGHAIILSTHVVETVPGLCTRAVFLADGRIVEEWDQAGLAAASRAPGDFEAVVMASLNRALAAVG